MRYLYAQLSNTLVLHQRSRLSGFTYLFVWFRRLTFARSASAQFFEDQTLQLSPLPVPAPVQLPAGLPSQLFGEAVMVTEFVHAYSPLLVPAGGAPLPLDQLLPALAGSAPHHKLLLDVVTMMLKVLLSDQTSEVRRRSYGGGGESGGTSWWELDFVDLALVICWWVVIAKLTHLYFMRLSKLICLL